MKTSLEFDWSRLSKGANHKEFEDMCLDLFRAEMGDDGFVPGPRWSGRDRGADAVFQGRIEGHKGTWKVACAIRQDVKALERKIEEERKSALKAKTYTGMVVMTPLNVPAPVVVRLKKQAAKGLKGAVVWPRSILEQKLKKHRWVAATYFGHPLLPGFIPVGHDKSGDLADQPDVSFVGRVADLERVRAFLDGASRILVVVAPGGSGKSRFIREVAAEARGRPIRRTTWARRPGIGMIEDGLKNGLPVQRPMLVALDDAGRALSEVSQLGMLAGDSGRGYDAKVVLGARSVDREAVESKLRGSGAPYKVLELSALTLDELAEIARLEHRALETAMARRLAKHFGPNVFLLRAAAQRLRAGENPRAITESGVRNDLAARLVRDAVRVLQPLCDQPKALQALLETTLDLPVRVGVASTEQTALLDAGLLRTVGDTLRFRSDVEGDIVLGYLLTQSWARGRLTNLLRDRDSILRRIRNLAAAGRGHPEDVIRQVCSDWRTNAAATEPSDRRAILKVLPHCAESAPEDVASLCTVYAQTSDAHTLADFSDIVVALARSQRQVAALRLLRTLVDVGVPAGRSSNHQVRALCNEVASIAHSSDLQQLAELCHQLATWLPSSPSPLVVEIAQGIVATLLSPTATWETSDAATLTMYEEAIPPTPEVIAFRRRAIELVAQMLGHSAVHVRMAGATLLASHARVGGGRVSKTLLREVQRDEFDSLAPAVEKLLGAEKDMRVLHEIQKGLVSRWATQAPGDARAELLLRDATWPVMLQAFQAADKPWVYRGDVVDAMAGAPDTDRWTWWCKRHQNRTTGLRPDEIEDLIVELSTAYPGAPGVIAVVEALTNAENSLHFLGVWCRTAPDLFEEAASVAPSGPTRDTLTRVLRRHVFAQPSFDLVGEIRALIERGASLDDIEKLLADMPPRWAPATVVEVARLLIEQPSLDFRHRGLALVRYEQRVARADAHALLLLALRDGPWVAGWETVWTLIHDADGQASLGARPLLRDAIEERLAEALRAEAWDAHGNDEWYVEQVIDLILLDDKARVRMLDRVLCETSAYDRNVGKIASPLLGTTDGVRMLTARFASWLEAGIGLPTCGWMLRNAIGDGGLLPGALDIGKPCLTDPSPHIKRAGIVLLSEMRLDPHACVELVELAVAGGEVSDGAEEVLSNFTMPRGAFSGGEIGEPPPAFITILEVLKQAYSLARTSKARAKLLEMQKHVSESIEWHVGHERKLLDPR